MYDVLDHGRMIADRVRTSAYARAIQATVRPDSVVVDLGTGSGVFALLAARAGARKVYAIESGSVIELARELAAANGVADRIDFFHADSRSVELPERADLLISDVRGVLPLFANAIPTMIDARTRFLCDGAAMIPRGESIFAALVESPVAYAHHTDAYQSSYGIDFAAARRLAVNHSRRTLVRADELLSAPVLWARLDYATIATADHAGKLELAAARDGVAHGFTLWFDCDLVDGIGFSNAPGAPETIYGRAFYPFEQPVALQAGETVTLDLAAKLIDDDDYLWRWTSRLGGKPLFRQSTFFSYPRRISVDAGPRIVLISDTAERFARATDESYWQSLRGDFPAVSAASVDYSAAVDAIASAGWFAFKGVVPLPLVTAIRQAVERVSADGWPLVFAFVFDELWSLVRTPALRALARALIGEDVAQTPYFWAHTVAARGWAPHTDAASEHEPPRLNLWIPLCDATLDNGCIYVIPRDRLAALGDFNRRVSFDRQATLSLMQSSRAVPASAGSLLGWDFRTIHWGSLRHDPTAAPRMSVAMELCSEAALGRMGEGAIPLDDLPDFRTRLRLIAGAMRTYTSWEPDLARFNDLRERLARV